MYQFAHKYLLYMQYFYIILFVLVLQEFYLGILIMNKELNFLVVLDDSEEMFKALKYAALRSVRTNGKPICIHLTHLILVIGKR